MPSAYLDLSRNRIISIMVLPWVSEQCSIICRIATEAAAEASRLVPAAESAIQNARQAAMALRGQPHELTVPYLHGLAASRLHSWLATQEDASGFQVLVLDVSCCLGMLWAGSNRLVMAGDALVAGQFCRQSDTDDGLQLCRRFPRQKLPLRDSKSAQ